jgi:hypothetical protein
MCGRVRLDNDYSEIKIRLKFAPDAPAPNYERDYNKPPTAPMLVAIRFVDGQRIPKMMKCGRRRNGHGRPVGDVAQSGQWRGNPKLHGADVRV